MVHKVITDFCWVTRNEIEYAFWKSGLFQYFNQFISCNSSPLGWLHEYRAPCDNRSGCAADDNQTCKAPSRHENAGPSRLLEPCVVVAALIVCPAPRPKPYHLAGLLSHEAGGLCSIAVSPLP